MPLTDTDMSLYGCVRDKLFMKIYNSNQMNSFMDSNMTQFSRSVMRAMNCSRCCLLTQQL